MFASDTDTEVVAHLVEDALGDTDDLTEAVRAVVAALEGAYSLVVVSSGHPGELVGVKVSSPMVVGLGNGETMLASDIPAVLARTRVVLPLGEGQIATVVGRRGARSPTSRARRSRSSRSRWTGTSRPRRRVATTGSCARRSTSSPTRSATRSSAGRTRAGSRWTSSGSPTTCSARCRRSSSSRAAPRSTPGSSRSTRSSTGRGCPWRSRSRASSATATRCSAPTR